jgi:DNA-binding GntR family transcriptional regulator
MADWSGHLKNKAANPVGERTPTYATIAEKLRQNIESGALPEGAVLLEGPLAALFGSSRSPVKQAFAALEAEKLVSRFDGRGLLIGKASVPKRLKITAEMLQLQPAAAVQKPFAWQSFYYDFEREIILRSVFGRFRVNELALARYFDVGRTVARDLLIHAQQVGIVSKGERSHWWIVPLDEERFHDLYELRCLLEPAALTSAIGKIPPSLLATMEQRLKEVIARFPHVSISTLDLLENDLHIDCVGYGSNPEIAEALKRTRCLLVSGKHIQSALKQTPLVDPFMEEHLDVVMALKKGNARAVKSALLAHLNASSQKAAERLAKFRATQGASTLPYIV